MKPATEKGEMISAFTVKTVTISYKWDIKPSSLGESPAVGWVEVLYLTHPKDWVLYPI